MPSHNSKKKLSWNVTEILGVQASQGGMSHRQIAEKLGIHRNRVLQIEQEALYKLNRKFKELRGLVK